MLYLTIVLALVKLVTSQLDEDLQHKYLTLPRREFIEYFNKQNYTWKAKYYEDLNIQHPVGNIFNPYLRSGFEIKTHDPATFKDLPVNFDAREQWSQCSTISELHDQGDCGSCWTFGTADVASDRMCIHLGSTVHLSQQDFQCLNDNVCDGGLASDAFNYWKDHGLVTQECKQYDVDALKTQTCQSKCTDPAMDYEGDKHYAKEVYQISSNNDDIKAEIYKNGPIQAAFAVYSDLDEYNTGIYVHSYGEYKSQHSVRVIGYGKENDEEYWLVANTWGTNWGLNGYLKIKCNQDLLGFEKYMYAGIPKN